MSYGRSLPQHLVPLLQEPFGILSHWLKRTIPILKQTQKIKPAASNNENSTVATLWFQDYLKAFSPRLGLYGPAYMGQDLLGSALVEMLEQNKFYVRTIDINSIVSTDLTSVDSLILSSFCELKRHQKAALYVPNLHSWWYTANPSTRDTFLSLLDQTRHASIIVLLTMEWEKEEIPFEISNLFSTFSTQQTFTGDWNKAICIMEPSKV